MSWLGIVVIVWLGFNALLACWCVIYTFRAEKKHDRNKKVENDE